MTETTNNDGVNEQSVQTKEMVYEFITPSDPITFKAINDKIALCAALIIGNGQALCKRLDDEGHDVMLPSMTVFKHKASEEIDKFIGKPFAEFTKEPDVLIKLGKAFESFAYGKLTDRHKFDESISLLKQGRELDEFKKKHEDKKRTSMSRWVDHAWSLGRAIANEAKAKEIAKQANQN